VTEHLIKEKGFPEKLYYRIGEVSRIVGVEPHVLRYWESEFPFLKPSRVVSKQRLYRQDKMLPIKQPLYEEKYTIAGAKKQLRQERIALSAGGNGSSEELFLLEIHDELLEILKRLQEQQP
jgi:DNA-binding transcriptional MerR regulator